MWRRVLNAVTALSLLLCVATAALWARSGRPDGDQLIFSAGGRLW